MRRFIGILTFIIILLFTSCFNYRDLNRLFFSTAVIIDIDDDDNIVLTTENFKAYRGAGEKEGTEVRVIFNGRGKTVYDALSEVIKTASYEINPSQIKAVVFTKKAAELGLDNFIDGIIRYQKPTLRAYLFVTEENPNELINIELKDEQFLGLFLENLMVSQGKLENVKQLRLDRYVNRRLQGSRIAVLPILKVQRMGTEDRIVADNGAVVQDDKMVETLSSDEIVAYNHVINEANVGYLYTENPNVEGKYVSLKILKNKTKVTTYFDGEKITLNKHIKTKVTLIEAQEKLNFLDDDVRKKIKESLEEKISQNCINLYTRMKEKGIDIYNVERHFHEKYPHERVENILEITDASTTVEVFIEGSNNTTDFR